MLLINALINVKPQGVGRGRTGGGGKGGGRAQAGYLT